MAATQTAKGEVDWGDGHHVRVIELSTIEPGATVAVTHGGPAVNPCLYVTHEVTTRPTSRDIVDVSHIRANDTTTTSSIVVDTSDQGDLTGCVVRLYFHFREAAAGGIS